MKRSKRETKTSWRSGARRCHWQLFEINNKQSREASWIFCLIERVSTNIQLKKKKEKETTRKNNFNHETKRELPDGLLFRDTNSRSNGVNKLMQTERRRIKSTHALSCLFRDVHPPLISFPFAAFISSIFTLFPRAERWQTFHNEVWPDLT